MAGYVHTAHRLRLVLLVLRSVDLERGLFIVTPLGSERTTTTTQGC
jgi:hypothetical protein